MNKNSKIKKLISICVAMAIIIASLMAGMVAFGDDLIAVNDRTFKDDNWRKIVLEVYDTNGDKFLSTSERTIKSGSLNLSGLLEDVCGEDAVIEDLSGVEYFENVKRLYVGNLGLKTLDVSSLKSLTQLTCQGNNLTSLKVGTNPNLLWINCASNELTSINISGCYSLNRLDCYSNKLEMLDVSSNSLLDTLTCQDNQLTRLDVTSNSVLTTLYCAKNHLTELDLSYNNKLSEVTQLMIGQQTISATAQISGKTIVVPVTLKRDKLVSTSLDTIAEGEADSGETKTTLGYSSTGNFYTKDVKAFQVYGHDGDTIEYEYNVGNSAVENMNVYISVSRDFYQVDFYTDESKSELMSSQFIKTGRNAILPTISDYPDDKIFGGWIGNYENVTEDSDVYIRWVNEHIWRVSKFDKGDVTIHCDDCGDEYSFDFMDVFGLEEDHMHFVPVLDVVKDGILNAKDYAKLTNQFK